MLHAYDKVKAGCKEDGSCNYVKHYLVDQVVYSLKVSLLMQGEIRYGMVTITTDEKIKKYALLN